MGNKNLQVALICSIGAKHVELRCLPRFTRAHFWTCLTKNIKVARFFFFLFFFVSGKTRNIAIQAVLQQTVAREWGYSFI